MPAQKQKCSSPVAVPKGFRIFFNVYHSDENDTKWNFDLDHNMGPNPACTPAGSILYQESIILYADTTRLFGLVPLRRLGTWGAHIRWSGAT
jgi:hypothetical protein